MDELEIIDGKVYVKVPPPQEVSIGELQSSIEVFKNQRSQKEEERVGRAASLAEIDSEISVLNEKILAYESAIAAIS